MTLNNFDEMLAWLDPDREQAALKHLKIRSRIIKIYTNRGCYFADEIADETDVRVCRMIKETVAKWHAGDDPALHFYSVARFIYLEWLHRPPVPPRPPEPEPPDKKELRHACLEHCLTQLQARQRGFILQFHEGEKRERIENRKRLAAAQGINTKALSLRAFRLHRDIRSCMDDCLKANRFDEIDMDVVH